MSNAQPARPYRGVSAVDRRAQRRARLQEACLDVVGAVGVANSTVDGVCASAGLIKRYFYESFADLDTLLGDALVTMLDDFHTELSAALADTPTDPHGRSHTAARALIDFLERDGRRARLYVEAPGHPTLAATLDEAYSRYVQLVLDMIPAPESPPRDTAALIVVAGTTQAAIAWLRGRIALDHDEVVTEIARVIELAVGPR